MTEQQKAILALIKAVKEQCATIRKIADKVEQQITQTK
jgi:hypothetical protein